MNGNPRAEVVFADIDGHRERIWYTVDRVRNNSESFQKREKVKDAKLRIGWTISHQYLDGGPTQDNIPLRLVHLDLTISKEDNRSGTINSELTLQAIRDDVHVACMILNNNRNPNAKYWNSNKQRLTVTRITDEAGNGLPFVHRHHELLVDLRRGLHQGNQIKLRVESEGKVFTDMTWDFDDNFFALLLFRWYPEPYGPGGSRFTHDTRVRSRKPFRPVSTGQELSFEEAEDYYEIHAVSKRPQKNTCIFAGKFDIYEEEFDGFKIRVFSYAAKIKGKAENMAGLANIFIRFYEQRLGSLPFEELNLIEVPHYGFGIAPAGTVLLTTEAYKPHRDIYAKWFSREINARLAHEIAHLWFGHKVIWAGSREQWLSESFAEYLSGLAMGRDKTRHGRRVFNFEQMKHEWLADTKTHADYGSIAGANQSTGSGQGAVRRAMLYSRGPLVLRMLHAMTGSRFFEILKRFSDEANMDFASTEDLKRIT